MRERTPQTFNHNDLYTAHDWSAFAHDFRVANTIEFGKRFEDVTSVADMSAGGTNIATEIAMYFGAPVLLGDYGAQYGYDLVGTLQETVPQIGVVDLYVCSETLEHLEDPDADLALIRDHCERLLLTTPIREKADEQSHGHLWVWDEYDVTEMLVTAGFEVEEYEESSGFWGFWRCK